MQDMLSLKPSLAERLRGVEERALLGAELKAELLGLVRGVAELEERHERLSRQVDEQSRRGADLASLYVAAHRLHSTLDRGQVLQAIEEVVASLLGCEELAVFERVGRPEVLAPVFSVGVPPGSLAVIAPGHGRIGDCLVSGELRLGDGSGEEPVACVPLKVDGGVTGVLVLFRLLDHKGRLEPSDVELLELLSLHAGTALHASRLQGRFRAAQ
jgi:GAF domain-containing protein